MNHPAKEDLVSLLYGELPPAKRDELNAHLQSCAECRTQFTAWQSTKRSLQSWQMPRAAGSTLHFARVMPWAAAALFMLCIGFGLGRFASPKVDVEQLRTSITSEMQTKFSQELQTARETDRKQVIVMLKDIEQQRLADYVQLRKDLETVAVVADEKLTKTERVLSQANLFAQTDRQP